MKYRFCFNQICVRKLMKIRLPKAHVADWHEI